MSTSIKTLNYNTINHNNNNKSIQSQPQHIKRLSVSKTVYDILHNQQHKTHNLHPYLSMIQQYNLCYPTVPKRISSADIKRRNNNNNNKQQVQINNNSNDDDDDIFIIKPNSDKLDNNKIRMKSDNHIKNNTDDNINIQQPATTKQQQQPNPPLEPKTTRSQQLRLQRLSYTQSSTTNTTATTILTQHIKRSSITKQQSVAKLEPIKQKDNVVIDDDNNQNQLNHSNIHSDSVNDDLNSLTQPQIKPQHNDSLITISDSTVDSNNTKLLIDNNINNNIQSNNIYNDETEQPVEQQDKSIELYSILHIDNDTLSQLQQQQADNHDNTLLTLEQRGILYARQQIEYTLQQYKSLFTTQYKHNELFLSGDMMYQLINVGGSLQNTIDAIKHIYNTKHDIQLTSYDDLCQYIQEYVTSNDTPTQSVDTT